MFDLPSEPQHGLATRVSTAINIWSFMMASLAGNSPIAYCTDIEL